MIIYIYPTAPRDFEQKNKKNAQNQTKTKQNNPKSRKDKALDAIYSHCGKRRVYETYLRKNPALAEKYLEFMIRNTDAVYVYWDKEKQAFSG